MKDFIAAMLAERSAVERLLSRGRGRLHMLGLAGVGMAGLAFHLQQRGFQVSGCDCASGALANWLKERGLALSLGHDPCHVVGMDALIRSTAVPPDHPEVLAARRAQIPVFRRGLVLAALLSSGPTLVVCGTHGKSTTVAMLVQALRQSGLAPSFCLGGVVEALGGVAGLGASGIMLAEADESDGSLAAYAPEMAVVTNIEFDHAEHFASFAELQSCFANFIAGVRRQVIYCADDAVATALCQKHPGAISYGLSARALWRARRVVLSGESSAFDLFYRGQRQGRLHLPVPGRHNVLNALAACAATSAWGGTFAALAAGLAAFQPVRRRFERVVNSAELLVISDYAHHPSELKAIWDNLQYNRRRRWLALFQPHRFSRTRALAKDFAKAFKGLDQLILAPVYPASEQPLSGGSSWDLYARIRRAAQVKAYCASSLAQAWDYLCRTLLPGDGLLILGAGDVEQLAAWAQRDIQRRGRAGLDPVPAWLAALRQLALPASRLRAREPMNRKTTLHVGGKADIFMSIASRADLARVLQWAALAQVPWTILGAGSNVLVSDLGVRGLVIRLCGAAFSGLRLVGPGQLSVGAGVSLAALTSWAAKHGYAGLEFLAGIPGTVGGALRMNAGAWGQAIGAKVLQVRCLNAAGEEQILLPPTLAFAYRQCPGLVGRIALEAVLALRPDDPAALSKRLAAIKRRRAWQKGLRSAGSAFRNPPGDFAGRLIEQAGLKGYRLGGARVSRRHANLIVTDKKATASDVGALLEIMRAAVADRSGVALIKEIVCLE